MKRRKSEKKELRKTQGMIIINKDVRELIIRSCMTRCDMIG